MKKGKILCLLLAVTCLWGCAKPAEQAPEQTEPAAAFAHPPITTEQELRDALQAYGRVSLGADIQLTQTLGMQDRLFDGGGHTITGMTYVEGDTTTEFGVMIGSGTVQNLNVKGAHRCLGDNADYPQNGDVRIKNVTADGTLYALSIGRGNRKGALYVENCTLRGWTNINRLKSAQFVNCTFGWNEAGDSGHFRTYLDATLIGCRFESKMDEDGNVVPYNIHFNKKTKNVVLTLEDCYVGDTLITKENVAELLKLSVHSNNVYVRNTAS